MRYVWQPTPQYRGNSWAINIVVLKAIHSKTPIFFLKTAVLLKLKNTYKTLNPDMHKFCTSLLQTCAKFMHIHVPWGVFLFLAGNTWGCHFVPGYQYRKILCGVTGMHLRRVNCTSPGYVASDPWKQAGSRSTGKTFSWKIKPFNSAPWCWRYWQYYFRVLAEAIHSKTPIFFKTAVLLKLKNT